MNESQLEHLEKIRQQYDWLPYPYIPIDRSARNDCIGLYFHNLVTSYYIRNQKVIETEGKLILDAGCGSGYKTLVLAEANPGAKVVGIDLSEKSLQVAKERLEYHHIKNFEFHQIALDEVPNLGLEFDYINCDEVIYMLPDSLAGLKALKAVLKPDGILRANLHSSLQRANFYRAREFATLLGLMDRNPEDLEIELLKEVMNSLKNSVDLKQKTWTSQIQKDPKGALMNHFIQGDKGSTIPEMFDLLDQAELEFISMLNWRQWDLMDLFQNPDDLPAFLAMSLPGLSLEEKHRFFELLHPVHRLFDFWCGHPNTAHFSIPVAEWSLEDWKTATAYLHPQLKVPETQEKMLEAMTKFQAFLISKYLLIPGLSEVWIDSALLNCIVPLWDAPQSVLSLAQRWHQLRPVDPVNLQPLQFEEALETVTQMLTTMADFGYVLVECDRSVPDR
ncbi:MAG TPA: class I SAM-dependent methyltransferase [Oscillatoriales cyanobacterium M59_W2019_021]|nr:class I SAM-dependent methyltransferase [Oscillatoriales cyanobacterium M4454_W2019_049]HIK49906.1 class I SAM-dependent methyltransferase [Oscillatoriales cyanobacterium M59_W2019_021]